MFLLQVWDLVSGRLLQTVVFPSSVMSVVMDTAEMRLFAGVTTGHIYCVNMYGQVWSGTVSFLFFFS